MRSKAGMANETKCPPLATLVGWFSNKKLRMLRSVLQRHTWSIISTSHTTTIPNRGANTWQKFGSITSRYIAGTNHIL